MTANPSDQSESATDETTPSSIPPSAPLSDASTEAPDPAPAEADTSAPQDDQAAAPDPTPADKAEAPAAEAAAEAPVAEAAAEAPADDEPAAKETPAADAEPAANAEQAADEAVAEAAASPVVDAALVGAVPEEATTGEPVATEDPAPTAETAGDTAPDSTADTDAATAEPAAAVEAAATQDAATEDAATQGAGDGGGQGRKKRRKGKGGGGQDADQAEAPSEKPKQEKKKPAGPDPVAITRQIGKTSEAAMAYVANPDPKLARMSRKHREAVITEIPPVTAGALLGPEALCRHFLASASSGRYRDLFFLWELFVAFPEDCKPVLASRQRAQEKARAKLRTATHLGLLGDATRVAEDIDRASGLPWRWLQEILEPMAPAIRQRPAVLAAMLRRAPDFQVEVPEDPSDRWLAEAAALKESGGDIPPAVDALLGANADRLPATVATLSMAHEQYADRVPALIDRVDLGAHDIGAIMAWARDHGHGDQLIGRIAAEIDTAAAQDRATGLATWKKWQGLGVDLPMPQSLAAPTLEGLDLGRPESAELIKVLVDNGADIDPQQILDTIAGDNRMLGEKAFEAFVCAGFDQVHLPLALEGNPMVRPDTRCPACQAWTWVRPGLEKRCPRTGCPLRSGQGTAAGTPEDASAAVDAAVASVDGGGWSGASEAPAPAASAVQAPARPTAPPPSAPRPAAAPPAAPAPQPAPAEAPTSPAQETPAAEVAAAEAPPAFVPEDAAPETAGPEATATDAPDPETPAPGTTASETTTPDAAEASETGQDADPGATGTGDERPQG